MQGISKGFLRDNVLGLSLVSIAFVCLTLAAVVYLGNRADYGFVFADDRGLDGPEFEVVERQDRAYERIAQAVTPAIVNIQSIQIVKVQMSPLLNDPYFRQFFGDMFEGIPREQREHALGSGVVVSPDGYILTNNHVVAHATDIRVFFSDNRNFKGKVVGADPQTDVAVVKVEGRGLPTVPLADSSSLRVADTVMAFGNPFGLKFTVTRGSVCALGRTASDVPLGEGQMYEDFIQTDAPINPGNSGGALVNIHGQVVGINTAILSASGGMEGEGGWNGVGFAIPSNMAGHIMDKLIKTGKVSRGYLGVSLEELTPNLARQFKVGNNAGVLISGVEPGTPAERAGLRAGDIIQSYNGRQVQSLEQLRLLVADTSPGTEVTLRILRDGQPQNVKLALQEMPSNPGEAPGGRHRVPSRGTLRGIAVQNLTPDIRDELGIPPQVRGVVITDLDPDSPAAQAGLRPGVVMESINRHPVNSRAEFERWAAEARGEVLLQVNYQGASQFVVIQPGGDSDDQGGDEGP